MFRRPILLNRPVKSKKASAYRPGAMPLASDEATETPVGLKRTARLADKLEECRCGR